MNKTSIIYNIRYIVTKTEVAVPKEPGDVLQEHAKNDETERYTRT